MNDVVIETPKGYKEILDETNALMFDQLSDLLCGSLLATLSASKRNGVFLELGTGSGLSTSWLLHGMDKESTLTTIDNDEKLVAIAKRHLGRDNRVKFIIGNGEELIKSIKPQSVDLIFADTWPGKYNHLAETLSLLREGGLYIIDDMSPQENWPEGHQTKAQNLIKDLENRNDLVTTKLCWSTGIMICTKTT